MFTYNQRAKIKNIPGSLLLLPSPPKKQYHEQLISLLCGTLILQYKTKSIEQQIDYFSSQDSDGTFTAYKTRQRYDNYIQNKLNLDNAKLNTFINQNRINSGLYENLLSEFSYFFYYQHQKNYLSGFVHLYRVLEYMSLTMPLIVISTQNNYQGAFSHIKQFFGSEKIEELGFFKKFVTVVFESVEQQESIVFPFESGKTFDTSEYKVLNKIGINSYEYDYQKMTIKFIDMIDFIVTVRNRFFHFKIGGAQNIQSFDFDVEKFFQLINQQICYFLAKIFFKIEILQIEKIKQLQI